MTNSDQEKQLERAWRCPTGWRYWSEVNNTHVGLWYTVTAFMFFLFAGSLALLMRVQLAVPDNDFLSMQTYNQVFTLHGSIMMFLFGVPIFEAFAILILPLLLGTRDLPFPRLSAYGFWCFLIGGIFVCGSIFFGVAPEGGWFMYPPLTTAWQDGIGPDIWLLGLSFIEIASIAAAIELIVGVLKTRPPGMRIHLMPLYAWYILVVAVMILFAFPPLIIGDLLFELQRALDWPFFDPARGGDPLLWQHLFWIFGHPEVYIIFLPSVALVAMIVPTFSQRPIVGYSWVVLAAVGTGFISFGLWVHHMYTTGLPAISLAFFSAASVAVALPTGVQIFCFLATVVTGNLVRSTPMLFVLGALAIFMAGGLTGVMVAIAPFDFQAHDSYFIVAHLHYVLIGGMLFPVLAGLYYYYPVVSGRMLDARSGRVVFWLIFSGFNITFLPMHLTGLLGMQRRVFTYAGNQGFDSLNLVSTIGAFVLACGILVLILDLLRSRHSALSQRNPWSAGTLEWLVDMPQKPWGVRSIPAISSRYPLWDDPDLVHEVDAGLHYLPDAENGRRETLITSTLDARPQQCLRVPTPSFKPLVSAVFTGGAFILPIWQWYYAAGLSATLALISILTWLWSDTLIIPAKNSRHVGRGLYLPLSASGPISVGWWAMCITLIADLCAFISLVFSYFFYWTVHGEFPPSSLPPPDPSALATGTVLSLFAWLLTCLAVRWNRQDKRMAFYAGLSLAAATTIAGTLILLNSLNGLDPVSHVYPAICSLMVIWVTLHLGTGMLMQLYCLARRAAGRMTAVHDGDIRNVQLYWYFTAVTVVLTTALLAGFSS